MLFLLQTQSISDTALAVEDNFGQRKMTHAGVECKDEEKVYEL